MLGPGKQPSSLRASSFSCCDRCDIISSKSHLFFFQFHRLFCSLLPPLWFQAPLCLQHLAIVRSKSTVCRCYSQWCGLLESKFKFSTQPTHGTKVGLFVWLMDEPRPYWLFDWNHCHTRSVPFKPSKIINSTLFPGAEGRAHQESKRECQIEGRFCAARSEKDFKARRWSRLWRRRVL